MAVDRTSPTLADSGKAPPAHCMVASGGGDAATVSSGRPQCWQKRLVTGFSFRQEEHVFIRRRSIGGDGDDTARRPAAVKE